jgi:hypothetical protein
MRNTSLQAFGMERAHASTHTHHTHTHLGFAAMVIVRLDGKPYLRRLQPNFERVTVGVSKIPASESQCLSRSCAGARKQKGVRVCITQVPAPELRGRDRDR